MCDTTQHPHAHAHAAQFWQARRQSSSACVALHVPSSAHSIVAYGLLFAVWLADRQCPRMHSSRAFFTVRPLYRLPWQDAAVHPPVVCLCLQSPCCAVSSKCIEGVWRMSTAFVDHLTCCSRVHVCSACMLACVGAGRVCAYIPATPLLLCFLVPCGGAVCRICAVFCWRNLLLRPPGYVKYCSCAARWAAVAADSFLPHLCIHSLHEIWHVRAGMSGRPPELVQL